MYQRLKTQCEKIIQEEIKHQFTAGACLTVLRRGELLFTAQAGCRDMDAGLPMTPDTILRLYSMTKPITGAAVMLLMERGALDLWEPVSRWLPGFRGQTVTCQDSIRPVPREVTVHDLLSMTSGLPYPGPGLLTEHAVTRSFERLKSSLDSESPVTTWDFANMLGENPLEFPPGSSWMYGASADVLGAVIEAVAGKRFGEFLKEELLEPLEMSDTGFWVPQEKRNRLARIYNSSDGRLQEAPTCHLGIRYEMDRPPAFESGGAGLVSTLEDYSHFAVMLSSGGSYHGRRILSPATVRYFTSPRLLPRQQEAMWENWEHMAGYSYGNLMRVLTVPGASVYQGREGEYGWDGWLGCYFSNSPQTGITFLLGMQKQNAGTNRLTRKLRNLIAAELEAEP